jgi:hypothetical protein
MLAGKGRLKKLPGTCWAFQNHLDEFQKKLREPGVLRFLDMHLKNFICLYFLWTFETTKKRGF